MTSLALKSPPLQSNAPDLDDLFRVHRAHLRILGMRLARDPAEADDLVQETMLRAFVHYASFTSGTNARAWLGRILRNLFIDRRRKQRADRRLEALLANEPMPRLGGDPSAELEAARTRVRIARALSELPEPFRHAVELVDLQENDYSTAARSMGCPEGTLMSRVHRGRKRLHDALEGPHAGSVAMMVA